ncbi:MAG: translation initiation factor IF-2 [Planctomycetota bacterium]
MTKKRVYDLAKEYGMKGQDLAAMLRDWGFLVKSHMSALEEADLLVIQGRLAAHGYGAAPVAEDDLSLGGLIVRKKKKKAGTARSDDDGDADRSETAESSDDEAHDAPSPAAPAVAEKPAAPSAPVEETTQVREEPAAPVAETPAAPVEETARPAEPARAEEAETVAEPEVAPAAPKDAAPKPVETKDAPKTDAPEEVVPAPRAAAKKDAGEAPSKPAPTAETTEKAGSDDDVEIVRPNEGRRRAKITGFIDLSKVQTNQPARRESRRLQSRDDGAVPDVQPTLGRGRKPLARGTDQGRGTLTAAELREREAGRFLRRHRPQTTGRRGGGGGRGGSRSSSVAGSPHSGSAVAIDSPITVKKLGDALAVKQNEVLRKAFDLLGFGAVNINSTLDEETAVLLAGEFDVELEVKHEVAAEEQLLEELRAQRSDVEDEALTVRTPTVAILGHVDHGKTTLIDTIRRSEIAGDESGGITQHIGAYRVHTQKGHAVTVVDTPGHAAFTAMRARGARAVDIAIVVVAADDGVMPQTEEAINHARAAKTPIVIALNKMDKPDANPEKVKQQLAGIDLVPEEWGGTTAIMPVSALKGDGIDALLERVFLEGELLELRAHEEGPASGVVLEAEVQQGRGIVAHLLVQDGSLKRGDVILAGEGYGRVRSMHNDRGDEIDHAGPSMPVEVSGLDKLPGIGEHFHVVPDLQRAKEVAEERERSTRMSTLAERRAVNKENLFAEVAQQARTALNLIVKADVQGSVEVLKNQLQDLEHDEIAVRVLHAGVGAVTESDVDLAATSDALILAFHVGTNSKARQAADRANVQIKNFRVVYELLDDIKRIMEGSLAPDIVEEITGHAEIRVIFRSSKFGNIAGSHVIDGKIHHDSRVRLLRDGTVVFTGYMGSLRREKDQAKEVREGFDCGIVIKDYDNIQEGDVVEAYRLKEVKRTL